MRSWTTITTLAATLALTLPVASHADDWGLHRVSVSAGLGAGGGFTLGGDARVRQVNDNVSFDIGAQYWSWNESYFGVDYGFSVFSIKPAATYTFELSNPQLHPYVTGGLSLNRVSTSRAAGSYGWLGTHLRGGLDYETDSGLNVGGYLGWGSAVSGSEIGARVTWTLDS